MYNSVHKIIFFTSQSYKLPNIFNFLKTHYMNDISKRFASYLMDDYKIKGTTEEDVDKAINRIFRFELLDDAQQVLFVEIMNEALDVPWIAEQLTGIWDRYNKEIYDCQKEDSYENN